MLLLLGRAYVHVFISGNYKRLYNLLTVTIKPKTIKYGKWYLWIDTCLKIISDRIEMNENQTKCPKIDK